MRLWNGVGISIQRYWAVLLGILSYVGAAFLQQLFEPVFDIHHPSLSVLILNILGLIVVLVTFVVLIAGGRDARRLSEIKIERDNLRSLVSGLGRDFFDVWHMQLAFWSKELNFTGSDRISIYKWSKDHFIMLGRYSENSAFSGRGRGVYPENEGCVGKAWFSNDGFSALDDLPDPKIESAAYVAQQEQACNMPAATLQGLRMKPRSIAAFVIKDATETRRSAIIVFESTEPNRLSRLDLSAFLQGERSRQLTLLMDAMKNQEPSLELAAQEGF